MKNNRKLKLNQEELRFFQKENQDFFIKYKLCHIIPLYRRIAAGLQSYAVAYLVGGYKGIRKVNKLKALMLHLKACQFDPGIAEDYKEFRKLLNKNFI